MSIQIITNFDAKSKMCYAGDDEHGEVFLEGVSKHNLRGLAKLTAAFIIDLAEQVAKDEELPKNIVIDNDSGLEKEDAIVFAIKDIVLEAISKELAVKQIASKMKRDGMPEELAEVLSSSIAETGWKVLKDREEKRDSEEGDEE